MLVSELVRTIDELAEVEAMAAAFMAAQSERVRRGCLGGDTFRSKS